MTFRNNLLCLMISLSASLCCLSAPVKTMLGAERHTEQEEENPNPYITDGLVAMWDGEWNAGVGVHDANAEIWVDISGNGNHLLFTDPSRITIGTDFISVGSSSGKISSIVRSSFPEIREGIANRSFSIDGYFHIDRYSGGASFWKTSNNGFRLYSSDNYNLRWLYVRGLTNISAYEVPIGNGVHICISIGASSASMFKDGIRVCAVNVGTGVEPDDEFYIGHNSVGYWKIHSTRIYSRQLTAEEVEYNYMIDKERFGLP